MPGTGVILFGAAAAWGLLALLAWRVVRLAPDGDPLRGVAMVALRAYARLWHGLRVVEGKQRIPARGEHGPLVVVANHTAGVDPLLVQAACPFEIRWIMAEEMRLPGLEPLWAWAGVIFVDRHSPSAAPVRVAIAHARDGGVVGLFPEGHIERPPRTLLPFHPGIGTLVRRTGARVLPIVIDGTPSASPTAWGSLARPSRSRLRVMAPIDYASEGMKPAQIARDLERRYREWTGWPMGTVPPEGYAAGKK